MLSATISLRALSFSSCRRGSKDSGSPLQKLWPQASHWLHHLQDHFPKLSTHREVECLFHQEIRQRSRKRRCDSWKTIWKEMHYHGVHVSRRGDSAGPRLPTRTSISYITLQPPHDTNRTQASRNEAERKRGRAVCESFARTAPRALLLYETYPPARGAAGESLSPDKSRRRPVPLARPGSRCRRKRVCTRPLKG